MLDRLLQRLAKALVDARIPYMIIGGQAVLFYGYPRLTQDIDVTLGVDTDAYDAVIAACQHAKLRPLVKQPELFVRDTHVLPTEDAPSGLRVDFVFSNTPYERQAIRRARRAKVGRATVSFATLDDLVIHKLIAGRPIDLEDVRVLLAKHPSKIDARYVRHWLKQVVATGVLDHDPLALFDRARHS